MDDLWAGSEVMAVLVFPDEDSLIDCAASDAQWKKRDAYVQIWTATQEESSDRSCFEQFIIAGGSIIHPKREQKLRTRVELKDAASREKTGFMER